MRHFSDFLNDKIAEATTYLVLEKFSPGRFIVPELTWPGRGTFYPIPGLSRAIRDTWSPYNDRRPYICDRRQLESKRL